MTTVPQPRRDRAGGRAAPDHGRQLPAGRSSRPASSACRARASSNSLSLKEGEEDFLAKARTVRRYGAGVGRHGLRRAGPGRHRRPQGGDPRARLPPARRRGRLPARRHRLRPERPRRRHWAWRSTPTSPGPFIDAVPRIKERCPGAKISGGIANLSFSFRGNEVVLRGDPLGLPLPRDPGGARHGHRQRRPARRLRGRPPGAPRARRGHPLRPPARTPPSAWSPSPRPCSGEGTKREGRPLLARGPRRGAAFAFALVHGIVDFIEDDTEEARQELPRPARRHRGPAHGRHVDRGRPLRLRAACSCRRS